MFSRCRSAVSALGRPSHTRFLSSAASSSAPIASTSSSSSSIPSRRNDGAAKVVDLLDDMLKRVDIVPPAEESSAVLRNLVANTVVGPRTLSPNYLLTPFLPRPDLTKAYPLGPPTSAARKMDPFIALGISPLDSPMNPFLRAEFCTSMGKIKSRGKTGLQRGTQRKMGKAVRRARSMGLVPMFGISVPGRR